MKPVTNIELIQKLEGEGSAPQTASNQVQDPALIAALEEGNAETAGETAALADVDNTPSPVGSLVGSLEGAFSTLSSIIAEPVAGVSGIVSGILSQDVENAVNTIETVRQSLAYEPKTEQGQEVLEGFGEVLSPVGKAITKVSENLGDWAFDATESPVAAAAAYSLPTLVMEGVGLKALKKLPESSPAKRELKAAQKKMLNDEVQKYNADVAAVKLNSKGEVVPDKVGEHLMDLGFKGNQTAVITNSSKESKKAMRKMLEVFNRSETNDIYKMTDKMSDVVGASVSRRLGALTNRRRKLGSQLDELVQGDLKSSTLSIDTPVAEFLGDLQKDYGLKPTIKADGTLTIGRIEGTPLQTKSMATTRRLIDDVLLVVNQKAKKGVVNAREAHKLKKTLDELVDSQKAQQAGMSNRTHGRLLALRKGINEELRNSSPQYARVNDELSSVINTMSPFDKYLKEGTSWADAKVSDVLGSALKSMSGDSAVAARLRNDIAKLEAGARQAGLKFADDPRALMTFKGTLENFFRIDTEDLAKTVGDYETALASNALDLGASMAVGNTFGVVHDIAKLRKLGLKKKQAEKLVNSKIEARKLLENALSE